MKLFSLDAEELFIKWETHVMKLGGEDLQINSKNLQLLKEDIQSQFEKEAKQVLAAKRAGGLGHTPKVKINNPRINSNTPKAYNVSDNVFEDLMYAGSSPAYKRRADVAVTPVRNKLPRHDLDETPGPMSSPTKSEVSISYMVTPFKSRKEPGKINETLNSHISLSSDDTVSPGGSRVKYSINVDPKKYTFRTMYQKLSEASETLDEQIETFIELIKEAYTLTDEDIANPATTSQNEVIAVGRIYSDDISSKNTTKLNSKSLLLESCRRLGAGMRILLNIDKIDDYVFFPGQIVAVKGINASGDYFTVTEILELPSLAAAATENADLKEVRARLSDTPLKIVACSGPYTTRDNLLFEPLSELITAINEKHKPDAVILMGPFIDTNHPLVQQGDFELTNPNFNDDATLDDLFRDRISNMIKSINPAISVIMVPHVRDTAAKHAAYPQEALDKRMLQLPRHVKTVPNPSVFSINEIKICCSTPDTYIDINRTVVSSGKYASLQGFSVAARQIISQRNTYPIFPGCLQNQGLLQRSTDSTETPSESLSTNSVDVSYIGLAEWTATPDILLIPSMLVNTAKVIDNVIVINPGMLAKGVSAGTYALITVMPPLIDESKDDTELVTHQLYDRARVDIIKI
ncbi:DNA polymerase alpha, subunit B [Nadsonia fulvescens var. elongata DSM 6958]|uniref:DNA polymerase alpha subunit B n=1 Tax=Nadsonia fulvescens var. elongata DSM 6958 TaxID=857566 RepID=A0A1E3PFM5_9ASCO|nr:DNA polymerase alpha, subunit B [Nadsonia fulvescens var. elongata DSM 6958]